MAINATKTTVVNVNRKIPSAKAHPIQSGNRTHSQDQSMYPVSLSATKISVRKIAGHVSEMLTDVLLDIVVPFMSLHFFIAHLSDNVN